MFDFLARLFRSEPSGAKAKERLRLVLLSDHLALAPDVIESLKTDLLEVLSRYVEVDTEHVDVTFEQREHEVAMLANVPILSMKAPHERPRPVAVALTETATGGEVAQTDAGAPSAEEPPEQVASVQTVSVESATQTDVPAETPVEVEAPPRADVIPLPVLSAEGAPAKPSRSRRRKRRKASVNGAPAQQSTTGAGTPTHL